MPSETGKIIIIFSTKNTAAVSVNHSYRSRIVRI